MSFAESTATYTSTGAAMLALKLALAASGGWTISKTYDGTSFDEGDILTTAGDMDGSGAFFLASMIGGPQFLFERIDATQWNITTSITAAFSGGSAGVLPSAVDQATSPSFGFPIFPGAGSFDADIGAEQQAPWRWYLHLVATDLSVSSVGVVADSGRPLLMTGGGGSLGLYQDASDADVFIAIHKMMLGTQSGGGGDLTAPTVTLVSPAANSQITRATPIVIDVTDASPLAAFVLWVAYANGDEEMVHRLGTFSAAYIGSTRTSIVGGYRYTLLRRGGWPFAPTFYVLPVDSSGNTP